jgi:hypothetical protein
MPRNFLAKEPYKIIILEKGFSPTEGVSLRMKLSGK